MEVMKVDSGCGPKMKTDSLGREKSRGERDLEVTDYRAQDEPGGKRDQKTVIKEQEELSVKDKEQVQQE